MTRGLLPITDYDLIIVSYSGGKDSLACLLHLLEIGADRSKIELWHQNVDGAPDDNKLMDWPVTESYVKATGEALGIPVRFQWREGGFESEMLRENSQTKPVSFEDANGNVVTLPTTSRSKKTTRMKFPQVSADLSVRWCSAYLKIDVAARAINNDPRLKTSKILFVTGERREESSARSKYNEVECHRCDTKSRRVDQWRAVIDWTESQVWEIIERWRCRPHPAYTLGWGRVSCLACIFGMADQWSSVRELMPETFQKIALYEIKFGTTIKKGESVTQQADKGTSYLVGKPERAKQQAIGHTFTAEDFIVPSDEAWTKPSGAFKRCGGPT